VTRPDGGIRARMPGLGFSGVVVSEPAFGTLPQIEVRMRDTSK
jgi:hypothetical protein